MKNLAISYIWWPGIDKDIENIVARCNTCQICQPAQLEHLYIHGNIQIDHGQESMLIMLDHFSENNFYS